MARRPFDPQAVLEALARGELGCGDLDMRIDRRGEWFYRGSRIGRPALVRLFAGVLHRGADGVHWLITPVERCRVEVEDVAFTGVAVERRGEGGAQLLEIRTNLGEEVAIDGEHPLRMREGVPYVRVRGELEARLLQPVFYELAELAVPAPQDPDCLGVWSGGSFFALGRLEGEEPGSDA
ncbi:DUF1285 domain-containing protein [Geminicoccaceae bacterium 1502E]|nr:DUF1285 domain-containing protein [Geminicoccaceae bacterium 1502E]